MHKKNNFLGIITIILISLVSFQAINNVNAQIIFIQSFRAQKTVSFGNGLNSYSDAASYQFSGSFADKVKEIFIKNDDSNLYIAVRVFSNNISDGLAVVFDANNDRQYAEDVKILFQNASLNRDGYFSGNSTINYQSSLDFTGKVSNITYIDGTTQFLYEYKISFVSNLPTEDIQVYDPNSFILGLDIVLIEGNNYISLANGNLTSIIANASNFLELILAGPGYYRTPDFQPAVITPQTSPSTQNKTPAGSPEYAASATPGFEIGITFFSIIILGILVRRSKK